MTSPGDAIGVRGKTFKSYTLKDRQKDLDEFQKTGVHPGIEAERRKAEAEALLALPDSDASRPRTYIEFAINKAVVGELRVIQQACTWVKVQSLCITMCPSVRSHNLASASLRRLL